MSVEEKTKLRLEIAHVLFLDIVGYSKLLIDEQSEALQELNRIVRETEARAKPRLPGNSSFSPRAMFFLLQQNGLSYYYMR